MLAIAVLLVMLFGGYQNFSLRVISAVDACVSRGAPLPQCDCLEQEIRAEIGVVRGAAMSAAGLERVLGIDARETLDAAIPVARARCAGDLT